MNVFYYYYFLFYKKVLEEEESHLTAILVLSFSISLVVNIIINLILIFSANFVLNKWSMLGVLVLIILYLYYRMYNKERAKQIIEMKPQFFNSKKLSILSTIIFFLTTLSILFWGPIFVRHLMELR